MAWRVPISEVLPDDLISHLDFVEWSMALPLSRLIPAWFALAAFLLPGASAARASAGGIVALKNASWDSVQVEIRIGSGSTCDLYPSLGSRTLKRGESWAIVSTGTVCWRREAMPGAQSLVWTSWQTNAIPATGVS